MIPWAVDAPHQVANMALPYGLNVCPKISGKTEIVLGLFNDVAVLSYVPLDLVGAYRYRFLFADRPFPHDDPNGVENIVKAVSFGRLALFLPRIQVVRETDGGIPRSGQLHAEI